MTDSTGGDHALKTTSAASGCLIEQLPHWMLPALFGVTALYVLLFGLLLRQWILPEILPHLHAGDGFLVGGDSVGYHQQALVMAQKIREIGWSAWSLKPLSQAPVGIAAVIYAVFGSNPLYLLPFNALIHGASAVALCSILRTILGDWRAALLGTVPFVLFPAAGYWHSQLLKDGVFILGIYLFLAAWMLLYSAQRLPFRRLAAATALALAGGFCVWMVREYALVVMSAISAGLVTMLLVFGAGWLRNRTVDRGDLLRRLALGIVACLALKFAAGLGTTVMKETPVGAQSIAGQNVEQVKMVVAGEVHIFCHGWKKTGWVPERLEDLAYSLATTRQGYLHPAYVNAGSSLDWGVCIDSIPALLGYLPRALQIALFAPFPRQWMESGSTAGSGAMRKVAGVEMLIAYAAFAGVLLVMLTLRRRPELWAALFFVVTLLWLYGLVTPNVGALYRMRYGFFMVLVGLGVGGWYSWWRRRHPVQSE